MSSLRYINYNRKSTDDSGYKQILSIPAQQEEARAMAARDGLAIVETISESRSAKIPHLRTGYRDMIRLVRAGKCNAIICWKLDRLARNMVEGGEIIELLQQGKIREIRTPHKTYTSRENTILLAVEFGSANQYSRDLSENVKRGIRTKAQMGVPNGLACFGYMNIRNADDTDRRWAVDKTRHAIVRKMFRRILNQQGSVRSTYFWALKHFHPTTPKRRKSGGHPISLSYFYTIITNPIYAGYFYYEGERYALQKDLPRAITEQEYVRVQRMIGNNFHTTRIRHESLYAGLLRSPEGEYMGPDYKFQVICDCKHKFAYLNCATCPQCSREITRMQNPKYLSYIYYYNSPRKKRRLPVKMISETTITKEIEAHLAGFTISDHFKEWMLQFAKETNKENYLHLAFATQQRKEKIASLEKRKKRLRFLLVDELIAPDEYQEDLDALQAEILSLQQVDEPSDAFVPALNTALNCLDEFQKGSVQQRKRIIQTLSSNLTWDEKKLCISCRKWVRTLKKLLQTLRAKKEWVELEKLVDLSSSKVYFDLLCPTLSTTLDTVRTEFYSQDSTE